MATVRYTTVNGEVIAEKRAGVRRFYVPDPLGSTRALLDSSQTQTDTFGYWPYGESQQRTGSTPTPLRFGGAGGAYQDSHQHCHVRGRELDLGRARWVTPQPSGSIGSATSDYIYAWDAPTNAHQFALAQAVAPPPLRTPPYTPTPVSPGRGAPSRIRPKPKPKPSPVGTIIGRLLGCLGLFILSESPAGEEVEREVCEEMERRGFRYGSRGEAMRRHFPRGTKVKTEKEADADSCIGGGGKHYRVRADGRVHTILCCPCIEGDGSVGERCRVS